MCYIAGCWNSTAGKPLDSYKVLSIEVAGLGLHNVGAVYCKMADSKMLQDMGGGGVIDRCRMWTAVTSMHNLEQLENIGPCDIGARCKMFGKGGGA